MPKTLFRKPHAQDSRRTASTPRQWRTLCEQALRRAKAVGDRRAEGLERALATHRERAILQAMGILSELDLDREFSVPPT